MIIYRNAKKSDIPRIVDIDRVSHPKPWDEKAFLCELSKQASGYNIFLVAEDGESGETAGYITGNIIVDYAHIINVTVNEKYRRKGIGEQLVMRVEQEAFKRKLGSVTLEVRESNTGAINLYKKRGYMEKARREKAYDNKEDEIIYWKMF